MYLVLNPNIDSTAAFTLHFIQVQMTVHTILIDTHVISDQIMVILTVKLNSKKGKYLWRTNNSLLQDGRLKETVKKTFEYLKLNDTNEIIGIILWEGVKAVVRGEIMKYSSVKKRQRKQIKMELELQIKVLEDKHKKSRSEIKQTAEEKTC